MARFRKYTSLLQLILEDGEDEATGKPIYRRKSFTRVKADATADQLYAAAHAFAGIQQLPLYKVNRRDSSKIRYN